jgi:glycosyltransferase involved in cell wall biosynthesis
MLEVLNTADVCVNPDKPTAMNDLSTMNKIMEYMALKKPIVQYTLKEGKFSAKEASLYAKNTNPIDFAEKIMFLLENPEKRIEMGEFGYNRVLNELSWEFEQEKLLSHYRKIMNLS